MVSGIALDDAEETIYVRFKGNAVYKYTYLGYTGNYCAAAFARILTAESQGKMVNQILKLSGEFAVDGPIEADQLPEFRV